MLSLIDTIKHEVLQPRRDEYLHFSTDLQNPRHSALAYVTGWPTPLSVQKHWGNVLPLLQGTAIHEQLHKIMSDVTPHYYPEVKIGPVIGKRYEWIGTADAYVEIDGVWWLVDYKTISGASLEFLHDKPKPEHLMQISAYNYFGDIKSTKIGILYLPTSPDYRRRWHEPIMMEVEPLPYSIIEARMLEVEAAVYKYSESGELPPANEGTFEWKYSKKSKGWEQWWKPHFSSRFCPWQNREHDPCGCSKQEAEMIDFSEEDPNADSQVEV